jgi:insulysin
MSFEIIKSAEDDRQYRYVTLENGMRVCLVSDPKTVAAAASVAVNVGSVHNPKELQGLAHFLEHMLFLGTEKYPDENTYNRTLSEHGGLSVNLRSACFDTLRAGHSNAFTSEEATVYYFDVHPDYLAKMVDIFAQFFIAPLFTESATLRELNAVQNEHSKNLQSDSWRFDLLKRSRANPDHPASWFHTGDLKHLLDDPKSKGIDTRAQLIAFHAKYYASSIMTACVLGRESLDDLERLARACFAPVANTSTPVPLHPTNHLVCCLCMCVHMCVRVQ